jgi:hypothetical protein
MQEGFPGGSTGQVYNPYTTSAAQGVGPQAAGPAAGFQLPRYLSPEQLQPEMRLALEQQAQAKLKSHMSPTKATIQMDHQEEVCI